MSNLGPGAFVVSGTDLANSYAGARISNPYQLGRAARVTFWVKVVLAGGSPITSVTVKLQHRYNDGTVTTSYLDLLSDKGDKGTVQGTIEAEHAYAGLSAPVAGTPFRFFLDNPAGVLDVTINVKTDQTGIAGDSVTIYPVLG